MDILIEKRDRQSAALGGWWARLQAARWVWVPLLVFGGTRLGILLVAYLAAGLMADSPFVPPYHLRGMANVLLRRLRRKYAHPPHRSALLAWNRLLVLHFRRGPNKTSQTFVFRPFFHPLDGAPPFPDRLNQRQSLGHGLDT